MRLPLALFLTALMAHPLRAQAGAGDLLVSPARAVLDSRTRSVELILSNRGNATDTYRIRTLRMEMKPDGQLVESAAPQAGVHAEDLIRFAPHQVTLEPGQTQVLRVMLRKPADLPDGEYRVHMLFQAIPPELAGTAAPQKDKPKGLSVRLVPIMGLAIPLIVRQGEVTAKAGLADLHIDAVGEARTLSFRLTRSGNASVYGNLEATFHPRSGKAAVVGVMNGVAVYPPLPAREIRMPLTTPQGTKLQGGTLTLTFQAPDDALPEAEARIEIP